MAKRKCACGCGQQFSGHPNKKFLNQRHKDKYHNRTNPRGYAAPKDDWDSYAETVHPFSQEAFDP